MEVQEWATILGRHQPKLRARNRRLERGRHRSRGLHSSSASSGRRLLLLVRWRLRFASLFL